MPPSAHQCKNSCKFLELASLLLNAESKYRWKQTQSLEANSFKALLLKFIIFAPCGQQSLRRPQRISGSESFGHILTGCGLPKAKIVVLQGSIASLSGIHRLHLSIFEKTTIGIVWAPGLQRPSPFRGLIKMKSEHVANA